MNQNSTPTSLWKVDRTHPDLAISIRDSLTDVMDPEIGFNVVQLGMVRDAEVKENQVLVTMILTTPFCPYGPSLLETAREKIENKIKMPTTVKMGFDMWDISMIDEDTRAELGFY